MSLIKKSDIRIEPVRALKDNYCYLIYRDGSKSAAVVDPSEASPIENALAKRGLNLGLILNTHHHHDHVGGNIALAAEFHCPIFCSTVDAERVPGATRALQNGEKIRFDEIEIEVLNIPGHTQGQIAFYIKDAEALFVGDTVFEMGCGRLFEGTPEQMYASLTKIKALPAQTKLYFGHEYAETNGRFAKQVQPENAAKIEQRLTDVRNEIAVTGSSIAPTIATENDVNPFFRAKSLNEFTQLRKARDIFT